MVNSNYDNRVREMAVKLARIRWDYSDDDEVSESLWRPQIGRAKKFIKEQATQARSAALRLSPVDSATIEYYLCEQGLIPIEESKLHNI